MCSVQGMSCCAERQAACLCSTCKLVRRRGPRLAPPTGARHILRWGRSAPSVIDRTAVSCSCKPVGQPAQRMAAGLAVHSACRGAVGGLVTRCSAATFRSVAAAASVRSSPFHRHHPPGRHCWAQRAALRRTWTLQRAIPASAVEMEVRRPRRPTAAPAASAAAAAGRAAASSAAGSPCCSCMVRALSSQRAGGQCGTCRGPGRRATQQQRCPRAPRCNPAAARCPTTAAAAWRRSRATTLPRRCRGSSRRWRTARCGARGSLRAPAAAAAHAATSTLPLPHSTHSFLPSTAR